MDAGFRRAAAQRRQAGDRRRRALGARAAGVAVTDRRWPLFGYWAGLFGGRYEELWRHRLRYAFPHGRVQRKDLSRRLDAIRRLRNRVAHHDSLLGQPVGDVAGSMLEIARWIDPAAADWLRNNEQVTRVLRQRPGHRS